MFVWVVELAVWFRHELSNSKVVRLGKAVRRDERSERERPRKADQCSMQTWHCLLKQTSGENVNLKKNVCKATKL